MPAELSPFAPLNPLQAQQLLQSHAADPGFVILDVRTRDEFEHGRLTGSINVDMYSFDFMERLAALPRASKYLVYCAVGSRSAWAVEFMRQHGFASAHDLLGGIYAWIGHGLPAVVGEE